MPDIPFEEYPEIPEINRDGSYPYDDNEAPDDDFPEDDYRDDPIPDDEVDDDLCNDLECETCYPDNTQVDIDPIISPSARPMWDFTTSNTTGTIDFSLTGDATEQQARLRDAQRRMEEILRERQDESRIEGTFRAVEPEGEDVPEVPEVPEVTPEVTSDEVEEVTPLIVPDIRGVYFNARGGNQIRAGSAFRNNDASGTTVQVSFWDMQPDRVRESYAELVAWMEENGYGYSSASPDYFHEGTMQVHILYYFALVPRDHRNYNSFAENLTQPECECGEEISYPSTQCPACEAMLYCTACRLFSTDVHMDPEYGCFCSRCARQCADADCEIGIYHNAQGRHCPACNPRVRCRGCADYLYIGTDSINEFTARNAVTHNYCDPCYSGLCRNCGTLVGVDMILEEESHSCTTCVSMNSHEEWDADSVLSADEIVIPTIPGREVIRMVGLEIEGANGENYSGHDGGNLLAHNLYGEGISRNPVMSGYHSSDGRRMTVHVERDSSVDWELVIGPMNVADPGQVDIMNRSVRVVRNMINDNTLKLDMRAGMHVHVGADKVPFHNAYNLHKLYMYMEDFLYRFGAAKWPYHRSITRRGRDASGKSPSTEGKLNFARTFSGQRYYGLSFDNYFNRYFEGCNCGARQYGLFDECSCDLGKCTFEFRLFNTTANTKKIHAYLAMSQALVAKAIELDEITNAREYPALDFITSRVSDMNGNTRNKYVREWEKRIVFVNEQLPLTSEEKKSIHYCIMNSEMGKVVSNADILLETEES